MGTENVVAGRPKSGTACIYAAPSGTALPTDSSTALAAAFLSCGYIGDDGVQETESRDSSTIKAWGTDTVKVLQTDYGLTYQFSFIEELNVNVQKLLNGPGNVTATAATAAHGNQLAIQRKSDPLPHNVWVVEIADGNAGKRIALGDAQITAKGDVTYSDSTVVTRQITLTCFPDDTGTYGFEYSDDGQKVIS